MSTNYVVRPPLFTPKTNPYIPESLQDVYGKGLSAPAVLRGSRWQASRGEEKIKQKIFITITRPVGVTYGRPDFGSLVPYRVFQPFGNTLRTEIKNDVDKALSLWVKEVDLINVQLEEDYENQSLALIIYYTIKGVGSESDVKIDFDLTGNPAYQKSSSFMLGGRSVFNGR